MLDPNTMDAKEPAVPSSLRRPKDSYEQVFPAFPEPFGAGAQPFVAGMAIVLSPLEVFH
jgi:hypothetical protein